MMPVRVISRAFSGFPEVTCLMADVDEIDALGLPVGAAAS
jgi:hypothetical protein